MATLKRRFFHPIVNQVRMSSLIPESEQGLEEDNVPLSPEAVQGEVENKNCWRFGDGAEKKVHENVARKLCGIQRKTAREMLYFLLIIYIQ